MGSRRDGHPASTNREADDNVRRISWTRRTITDGTENGDSRGYSRVQTKVNAQNLILQKHDQIGKRLLMQLVGGYVNVMITAPNRSLITQQQQQQPGHGVGPRTRRSKHLYKETSHLFAPKDVRYTLLHQKRMFMVWDSREASTWVLLLLETYAAHYDENVPCITRTPTPTHEHRYTHDKS